MSGTEATAAASSVRLAPAATDLDKSVDSVPSLLVPPSGDAESDALIVLLMAQGQERDQALASGREDLQRLKTRIHEALDRMKAALKKAAEAKRKSGFWGKLGKSLGGVGRWAAVGLSVAVAVGSLGAAAPVAAMAIAGAVLSMGAACEGQWHVMQKAGLDATTAGALSLTMSLAGSACTLGASGFGFGDIGEMALDAGKVAVGAAAMGEGVSTLEQAYADRDSGYAEAEAKQARADQARAQRLIQWVLEHMEDRENEQQRKVDAGAETICTHNESMMLAATRA
jgi:hypothetical protein